eukprot:TRINITY_DN12505_c0_g1_i3.p1 TRINITY_DN12505_c0_g1~~TRINITY_DN12505_c0_g1_i3.p1  ORF type:complete len:131 (+),score=19.60 TRINITY_DN12505_c0_g1_i3:196-588(+)
MSLSSEERERLRAEREARGRQMRAFSESRGDSRTAPEKYVEKLTGIQTDQKVPTRERPSCTSVFKQGAIFGKGLYLYIVILSGCLLGTIIGGVGGYTRKQPWRVTARSCVLLSIMFGCILGGGSLMRTPC